MFKAAKSPTVKEKITKLEENKRKRSVRIKLAEKVKHSWMDGKDIIPLTGLELNILIKL